MLKVEKRIKKESLVAWILIDKNLGLKAIKARVIIVIDFGRFNYNKNRKTKIRVITPAKALRY